MLHLSSQWFSHTSAVVLAVPDWKKASSNTKFHFRPYIRTSSTKDDSAMQTHEKKSGSANYRGNTADHEGLHIVGSDEGCEQTMLYVRCQF